ncbi:hypothetical protein HY969_00130 [Candidatus Kaiserbacteria bacterium]|nr:hypothetical protein [Candidatus Kaiserbacteria bacterium]
MQPEHKTPEHFLGELFVLASASLLLVFILQIPPTQAAQGSGNIACKGTAKNYKCNYKDKGCQKKDKNKGQPYKKDLPCQETCGKSGGVAKGKCVFEGTGRCKTTTTCQGKVPKKVDPSGNPKKEEGKGGEGMPKLPDPPKGDEKKPEQPKKDDQKENAVCQYSWLTESQRQALKCPPANTTTQS